MNEGRQQRRPGRPQRRGGGGWAGRAAGGSGRAGYQSGRGGQGSRGSWRGERDERGYRGERSEGRGQRGERADRSERGYRGEGREQRGERGGPWRERRDGGGWAGRAAGGSGRAGYQSGQGSRGSWRGERADRSWRGERDERRDRGERGESREQRRWGDDRRHRDGWAPRAEREGRSGWMNRDRRDDRTERGESRGQRRWGDDRRDRSASRPGWADRGGPERAGRPRDRSGGGRIRYGGTARRHDPGQRSAQRPSERSRTGDAARRVAFEALRAVDEGAYANLDLPRRIRAERLNRQDAAFATELAYGAIRMRGMYDPIIAEVAGRPIGDIDAGTLAVLRLGAHQILGMRVPDHAAVAETVALTRHMVGTGAAGFVNAVLRRISERTPREWSGFLGAQADDDIARLALIHSHPEWIVRAFRSALLGHGTATAETADAELTALLEADNATPAVTLVARPGLAEAAELAGAGAEPARLSPIGAVLASGGAPGAIEAVRSGRAAVQDEGSQLIALALASIELTGGQPGPGAEGGEAAAGPGADEALPAAGGEQDGAAGQPAEGGSPGEADASPVAGDGPEAENPAGDAPRDRENAGGEQADAAPASSGRRQRWLDLAAGPGGKLAVLAALAAGRDVEVFANEISPHRTRLAEQAVAAALDAGAQVYVGTGDGRTLGEEEPGGFDRVLVDAPCSGLGSLRRRPESRWRRDPGDLASLTRLQADLLASAIAATRPGGVIAYSTCSPHLAETRLLVSDVVARHPQVELLDAREILEQVASAPIGRLGEGPFAQLWPHVHGTDAMFLAVLRVRPSGEPATLPAESAAQAAQAGLPAD